MCYSKQYLLSLAYFRVSVGREDVVGEWATETFIARGHMTRSCAVFTLCCDYRSLHIQFPPVSLCLHCCLWVSSEV